MKIRAFFVDFYGTVVHEDGEIIKQITDIICDTGKVGDKSEVGTFWWQRFQSLFQNAYGDSFETQRVLEKKSLEDTLERFHSNADVGRLSSLMFEHWVKPPIFEESKTFFETSPIPLYIVSNIDTADVNKAIGWHGLTPAGVFTSEDARAYKPRPELFELALSSTGLKPDEVIHIGDSISSDINGAAATGIRTLWLNRCGRNVPCGVESISNLLEAFEFIK